MVKMLFLTPGDTLFQMAEVHRQIQVQLEDVVSARLGPHRDPACLCVPYPLYWFCMATVWI